MAFPGAQYTQTDLQQLQIRQRHEAPHLQQAIEQEYLAQARTNTAQRPLHLETQSWATNDSPASAGASAPTDLTRFKRR